MTSPAAAPADCPFCPLDPDDTVPLEQGAVTLYCTAELACAVYHQAVAMRAGSAPPAVLDPDDSGHAVVFVGSDPSVGRTVLCGQRFVDITFGPNVQVCVRAVEEAVPVCPRHGPRAAPLPWGMSPPAPV